MKQPQFHDEMSLAEAAESLGKQAMKFSLVPSFTVRHFPDSKQFFIPAEETGEPLTPEEAYFRFRSLILDSGQMQASDLANSGDR